MTICVMFSRRAKRRISSGRSCPASRAVLGPEAFGEAEAFVDAPQRDLVGRLGAGLFEGDGGPGGVQPGREAARRAHDGFGRAVGADADQQPIGRRPGALDRVAAQVVDHLAVDPLGGAAQGEFAQRGEVAGLEEAVCGAPGVLRQVDAPLAEPRDQFGRRDVDDDDVVGFLQHRVGHRLAHDDAGDARDDVRQPFEMLDVDRGPDVDAGAQQFLDVLVALGVAAVRGVRMGQFVDDHQRGGVAAAPRRGRIR